MLDYIKSLRQLVFVTGICHLILEMLENYIHTNKRKYKIILGLANKIKKMQPLYVKPHYIYNKI